MRVRVDLLCKAPAGQQQSNAVGFTLAVFPKYVMTFQRLSYGEASVLEIEIFQKRRNGAKRASYMSVMILSPSLHGFMTILA